MYNYWLTTGEIIKHKKYGKGFIIKANNIDQVWAMQVFKTSEVKVLGLVDVEQIEVLNDD